MICVKGAFGAGDQMTPELAARLSQCAERHSARVHLRCGDKRVRLNSLIGILALDLRRGGTFEVIAEDGDAQNAADDIVRLLKGA